MWCKLERKICYVRGRRKNYNVVKKKGTFFAYAFRTRKTHDFFFVCTIFCMNHLLNSSSATPGLFAHVTLDVIRRWGRRDTRKSRRMAAATNFKILHLINLFWFMQMYYLPFFASIHMSLFHRSKYITWRSWASSSIFYVILDEH